MLNSWWQVLQKLKFVKMLAVLGILGLLFLILGLCGYLSSPSVEGDSQKKWRLVAALNADQLATACDSYKQDNGHYPGTTDNAALYTILHTNQPGPENQRGIRYADIGPKYISPNGEVLDPWKTPLRIVFDDHSVTVTSAGADKLFDTPDDIIKRR